jgi:hypothetical protein
MKATPLKPCHGSVYLFLPFLNLFLRSVIIMYFFSHFIPFLSVLSSLFIFYALLCSILVLCPRKHKLVCFIYKINEDFLFGLFGFIVASVNFVFLIIRCDSNRSISLLT